VFVAHLAALSARVTYKMMKKEMGWIKNGPVHMRILSVSYKPQHVKKEKNGLILAHFSEKR